MSTTRREVSRIRWVRAEANALATSPASAAVGTIEPRSLVEPIRKIIARVQGHFLQAKAIDIDMSERLLEVSAPGTGENFYVP